MEGRPLLVTAALIRKDNRILVAQRLPDSRFEPNRWEFPGGKVDFGEYPAESLERELEEELGIQVKAGSFYDLISHVYDQNGLKRHVVVLFYLCDIISGVPEAIDCQDLKWVTRESMADLMYVEGDRPIVERILNDERIWN